MSKRYPAEQRERAVEMSLTPRRIPLTVRCVQSYRPEARCRVAAHLHPTNPDQRRQDARRDHH